MKDYKGLIKQFTGFIVLIISIYISRFFPSWIESHYSLVIFPKLATALKFIFGWISIPLFFPLCIYLIYRLSGSIKKAEKHWIPISEVVLKYLLFITAAFYILWGYSYQRIKVSEKLAIQEDLVNDSLVINAFNQTGFRLDSISKLVHYGKDTIHIPGDINSIVYNSVKSVLESLGYMHFKIGKPKEFWPKGFLLRFSTAGFYMPFTGEAYYDGGLHPLQLPFVLCHEYLHAQGFADEGECNFIAYLACKASNNSLFKYSADISLFKTIRGLELEDADSLRISYPLSDLVKKDMKDISETMARYPDYVPELRDFLYDTYLKLQGIKEGEHNYDNFVQLLIKYNLIHRNVF